MRLRWIFAIALCFGAVLAARETPAGDPTESFSGCANFRADSDLVIVPVNVFDSQNRVVNRLDSAYFRVFEDGVEQHIVAA